MRLWFSLEQEEVMPITLNQKESINIVRDFTTEQKPEGYNREIHGPAEI